MATAVAVPFNPIADMSGRQKAVIMAGTMLGLFTAAMDQTIVGTSMPRIIAQLGGFGLFAWVGTGFMLASTATLPIVGKLSDIFGRKPFYMAGIIILMIGSALCGSSQNIEQLIAFRVIQGFGAGMIMGLAFAILGDVFTPAERGRWAGLMSAVFASASVLGPLIGGTLTDHADWRWVFYVNLPLGAIALTVLFFGMPSFRPSRHDRLDIPGAVLLLAGVVPLLLAFSWAGSRYDWISPQVIGLFLWAAVALAAFCYVETRTEQPLLPLGLFKNRVFSVASAVTLLSGFGMMGAMFYIPLFVQGVIGSSATNSGLVTMPMMIAMAISSAIAGQAMSRLGRYKLLGTVGLTIMAAGMFLLSRLTVDSAKSDVTIGMVVLGIGLGSAIPLYMLAVQNAVSYRLMGVATSTQQFLRAVGGTMGVAVMFSLIQAKYHSGLTESVPTAVRDNPEASGAINDPQFLLNDQAAAQIEQGFAGFGPQGVQLFDATIQAVRESLAVAIADTFLISTLVVLGCVVISLFMKEIPLRKVHFGAEEGFVPPPDEAEADQPLPAPAPSFASTAESGDAAAPARELPAAEPGAAWTASARLNDGR
jgi:EmrB/QacA subfamily drug resistance transporter